MVFYKILLVIVVTVHLVLFFTNILAMFVLPFYTPWYVSVPLISFLIRLATVERECPITLIENILRRKVGMRTIRSFGGHYIMKWVYIGTDWFKSKIKKIPY